MLTKQHHRLRLIGSIIALVLLASCSIQRFAMNKIAGSLAGGGGTLFSGDEDPQLIADAMPFTLKMYEGIAAQTPDNPEIRLGTGKAFCMYAYAFVQTPAQQVSDSLLEQKNAQLKRAAHLFLRGRDYILEGLELRHPGFRDQLGRDRDSALLRTTIADTGYLYWAGASWLGAFTADKFNLSLALSVPTAFALVKRVLELHEGFGNGMVHELLVSWYGSVPTSMGGSEEKARHHFQQSLEFSKGHHAGAYISLAQSVSVKNQNVEEFTMLLKKALAVDPDRDPSQRLATILAHRKAQWLLDHTDDFFLLDTGVPPQ